MPRSGTTLVEQIVSSHSKVQAAGELIFVKTLGDDLATGMKEASKTNVSVFKVRGPGTNQPFKANEYEHQLIDWNFGRNIKFDKADTIGNLRKLVFPNHRPEGTNTTSKGCIIKREWRDQAMTASNTQLDKINDLKYPSEENTNTSAIRAQISDEYNKLREINTPEYNRLSETLQNMLLPNYTIFSVEYTGTVIKITNKILTNILFIDFKM